jgi:hypothetical protein
MLKLPFVCQRAIWSRAGSSSASVPWSWRALFSFATGGALSATVGAQPKPAVTLRYRLDSKTEQTIDASAIGAGRQQSATDRSAFLRVTVMDSAGGKAFHFLLDSIVHRGSDVPTGTVATSDSARGKRWTAFMAPDGNVSLQDRAENAGALGLAIEGQLEDFFPRLTTVVRPGEQWTASTERSQRVPNGALLVKRATRFSAVAGAAWDGVRADRVDLSFSTTTSGSQKFGGTPATVDGKSTGTGSAYLTAAGIYVGGVRTEKTERRLLLAGAPAPVTIQAESSSSVSLLR